MRTPVLKKVTIRKPNSVKATSAKKASSKIAINGPCKIIPAKKNSKSAGIIAIKRIVPRVGAKYLATRINRIITNGMVIPANAGCNAFIRAATNNSSTPHNIPKKNIRGIC